jgi:hypothetical protein
MGAFPISFILAFIKRPKITSGTCFFAVWMIVKPEKLLNKNI